MVKTNNSINGKKNPEMADIFCKYGHAYIESHSMPLEHYKIMNAIDLFFSLGHLLSMVRQTLHFSP